MPLIEKYNGYDIYDPSSKGKAGNNGIQLSASIQIRNGSMLVKNIVYKIFHAHSGRTTDNRIEAIQKAKSWIDDRFKK